MPLVVGSAWGCYNKYVHLILLSAVSSCFLTCYTNQPYHGQRPKPEPVAQHHTEHSSQNRGQDPRRARAARPFEGLEQLCQLIQNCVERGTRAREGPIECDRRQRQQRTRRRATAGNGAGRYGKAERSPGAPALRNGVSANHTIYRHSNGLPDISLCARISSFSSSLQTPKAPVTMSGSPLTVPCQVNLFSNGRIPNF